MNGEEERKPIEIVKGIYLGWFVKGPKYRYRCVICDRKYFSDAPELNAPTVCHLCHTGTARKCCRRRRIG